MTITFGSVGDIISVSLLVKDVLVALNDNRGSVAEYQEIIRELYILDRALLQVSQFSRQHEATPKLASLCHVAGKAVRDCQHSIETFLRRLEKYRSTLSAGSTSTVLGKAARKLQFAADKKDLSQFRAEIVAHSGSLNMLLVVANLKMVTVSEENIKNQVEKNFSSTNRILHEHDATLHDIQHRLTENNQLIGSGNLTLTMIADRLQWIRNLSTGLKTMMTNIFFINIATYHSVLSLQSRLPDPAERSMALFQEPIIFEDAIGRLAPVHVQFVNSWEMFDSVLEMRFEGAPGLEKIKRKEYALQDQATRQDVDRERKFDVSFLPGQKVQMSMIFQAINNYAGCPRCQSFSDTNPEFPEVDIKCKSCGIVFRHTISTPQNVGFRNDPLPTLKRQRGHADDSEIDETDLTKFKRIRMIRNLASPPTARAMAIPRAREEVPPPLPPPRYFGGLNEGQYSGWKWGDTNSSKDDVSTHDFEPPNVIDQGGKKSPTHSTMSSHSSYGASYVQIKGVKYASSLPSSFSVATSSSIYAASTQSLYTTNSAQSSRKHDYGNKPPVITVQGGQPNDICTSTSAPNSGYYN